MTYQIEVGHTAQAIRLGLNGNAGELSTTRRQWFANYDGTRCHQNGVGYNLAPGGDRTVAPGDGINWEEVKLTVPGVPAEAGSKIIERGSLDDLKALAYNTTVDEFAVEGEEITTDDIDMNGHYLRVASLTEYIWCRMNY